MHGVSDRCENEQGFDATCQFDVTKRGKELNDPSRTNPRLGRADAGAYIDRALPSVTMRCYAPPPVVLPPCSENGGFAGLFHCAVPSRWGHHSMLDLAMGENVSRPLRTRHENPGLSPPLLDAGARQINRPAQ